MIKFAERFFQLHFLYLQYFIGFILYVINNKSTLYDEYMSCIINDCKRKKNNEINHQKLSINKYKAQK